MLVEAHTTNHSSSARGPRTRHDRTRGTNSDWKSRKTRKTKPTRPVTLESSPHKIAKFPQLPNDSLAPPALRCSSQTASADCCRAAQNAGKQGTKRPPKNPPHTRPRILKDFLIPTIQHGKPRRTRKRRSNSPNMQAIASHTRTATQQPPRYLRRLSEAHTTNHSSSARGPRTRHDRTRGTNSDWKSRKTRKTKPTRPVTFSHK